MSILVSLLLVDHERENYSTTLFHYCCSDIENKEYVTWEDVEFYLLVRVTQSK
jgi:hypothetical protein